jgi:hypothetical protein
MWFRVFGSRETMLQPAALQQVLVNLGLDLPLHVAGDDCGWTSVEIPLTPPLRIERYLSDEDDLRGELDSWAAAVESWRLDAAPLMQQIIATRQLFTWQVPDNAAIEFYETLARHFASESAGVYQIDGLGFFAADGSLLVPEP